MFGKEKQIRRNLTCCLVLFLIAAIFLCGIFSSDIAFAELPESYETRLAADNDFGWQLGSDYLDMDAVKTTVLSWMASSDYDFDSIKKNPIIIAIIDTGILPDHDIFEDVLLTDKNGKIYYNAISSTKTIHARGGDKKYTNPYDIYDDVDNYHGTHVAGIAATLIKYLDLEEYIKILPIKAGYPDYDSAKDEALGVFDSDSVGRAINFALGQDASVINMSFANKTSLSAWTNLVGSEMVQGEDDGRGAVFVAAAGNLDPKKSETPSPSYYPAASPNVIGVMNYGNTENGMKLSSASNYDAIAYSICAPGTSIFSASGPENTNDSYKSLSGTSMASPVVSVAAALLTMKYRATEAKTDVITNGALIKKMIEYHDCATISAGTNGKVSLRVLELNDMLNTDFYGDEVYREILFNAPPTGVKIDASSNSVMLGTGDEVTLTARVQPSDTVTNLVYEWTMKNPSGDEVVIGDTKTITYKPPQRIGYYSITVTVTVGGNIATSVTITKDIEVVNFVPNSSNSYIINNETEKLDSEKKIKPSQELVLSLYGMEYAGSSTYITWYVNDVVVSAENVFVFSEEKTGTYVIRADVRGVTVATVTVKVGNYILLDGDLTAYEYAAIGLSAAAVLGVIVFVVVRQTRIKKSKKD